MDGRCLRFYLVVAVLVVGFVEPVQQVRAQGTTASLTGDQAVYRDGKVNIPLTDEYQVGALFHTQGIGITLRRGYYLNAFVIRNVGLDLTYFKHPKEIQTTNPVYENGRPYVFGKLNTLQILRLWFGKQNLHAEKLRRDAVRFSTFWKGGVALGVLKPIYLEIGYPDIPYDYTATERYDPDAHFSDNIYGRADWSNGLDELTLVPGLHATYGLDFEYGDERFMPKSLTTGVSIDAFLVEPEVFAAKFEQNNRLFVTLFATFEVGRNWTR
ncbi:MAG: hypothetical protein CL845_06845 [Crocinitomicaceae bacterium]|nr:hypothetical protein [Crocinitomicaceae bacterium]